MISCKIWKKIFKKIITFYLDLKSKKLKLRDWCLFCFVFDKLYMYMKKNEPDRKHLENTYLTKHLVSNTKKRNCLMDSICTLINF